VSVDWAKHVVLTTSLWALAGVAAAAPLSASMESPADAVHAAPARAEAASLEFGSWTRWSDADAPTSSGAATGSGPQFGRLRLGIAVPALRQGDTLLPATGPRWSMSGARPTLEYRLAPNQVVRLRGLRRGASLTLRWDF